MKPKIDADGRQSANKWQGFGRNVRSVDGLWRTFHSDVKNLKKKKEKSTSASGNGLLQSSARPQKRVAGSRCYSGGNL